MYLDDQELSKTITVPLNVNDSIADIANHIVELYTDGKNMRDPTYSLRIENPAINGRIIP